MYFRTLETCALKYANFILQTLGLVWQAALKKTKVNLDLLINADMLLMVEK